MNVTRKLVKIISFMMPLIFLFSMASFNAVAKESDDEEDKKVVRVGYMIYAGYQEGGEGEYKSGCAYEYYQKIRYYTGWEYEYVYGSISDMFDMLEKGEIDILSMVNYTDERAEKYLFSEEPHGVEAFYIYAREGDDSISAADISTINGKKVGVTTGTYQYDFFVQWCKEQNINCDIILYEYTEDLHDALTKGDVDVIVDVRVLEDGANIHPWKSVYRFDSAMLYFAVNKQRTDILEELNDAQAQIIASDEFYAYMLLQKYHDGTNYHNRYLTEEQQEYVDNCGVLKVGYLDGTNPITYTDSKTGKMTGFAADYLDAMTKEYGLQFETIPYDSETQLIEDLIYHKIDIVVPVGLGYHSAEELNIALTTPIASLPMSVIYKSSTGSDIFDTVAVIEGSITQEAFIRQNYPEAEIYYVGSTKEALNAIEHGLADCYFVRSNSMDLMNDKYKIYEKFNTLSVMHNMEVFMVSRIEDTTLSVVLDKGITLVAEAEEDSAKIKYAYEKKETSLRKALKDNIHIVIIIIIITILIVVVIFGIYRLKLEVAHIKTLQDAKDRAEEARIEAEKARHAKTDFLTQMSHDIRTPMNAIIGFTNFAKEIDDINIIKNDYIPKIEAASNQLIMLINDVLEMSRIESGKMKFTRGDHDVIAMMESVITVIGIQAEEKGIAIDFNADVKDRCVYCDENHLNRVLVNLMSNAVKFTPSGGKITLTVKQEEDNTPNCASYEIKVSDTGIGIAPDFIDKVFEPFERERTSTVSRMQGTGLGLAIVKRIVDAADDTITVESTLGKGTTFTLHAQFLLADPNCKISNQHIGKLKTIQSLQEIKEYFKGKRVLLVEDNEFNSVIAETIMENAGFIVETAFDGQMAVNKIVNAPTTYYYDFVLMDIQMPVMDGYEAARQIRKLQDDRSKVKIIAVTANAFDSDRNEAIMVGMNGYVSKPIDINVLYNTLLDIADEQI